MSEYTKYFAVRDLAPADVREILGTNKIVSIVEIDPPKAEEPYQWVVVTAPADSGFKDGQFYHESKWKTMTTLFHKALFFWLDEGQVGWTLSIAEDGKTAEYEFPADGSSSLAAEEAERLAKFLDVSEESLRPTLSAEKSYEFCQLIGMPYLEMLNQDHTCGFDYRDRGYSLLSTEVAD